MSSKESHKLKELGPKKYKEQIEKCNKFYDKNMAGKRCPRTGEYYNPISFTDPREPKFKIGGATIAYDKCSNCSEYFALKRTTRMIICSKCSTLNSWSKEDIEKLREVKDD